MRTVDRGFDFYFNRAKNEAVVREPAGETLLVYRRMRPMPMMAGPSR